MLPLPRDGADRLDWLAFEQAGVLTSGQAVRLLGRGVVRGRVRSGRWRSVCRGILLTHNGRIEHHQQLWVAVLAAGSGAVLGGATAATEGGVRGLRAGPIRIVVPAGRNASTRLPHLPIDMPAVRIGRTRVLPESHLQIGRPPRTTVARSVIDAARWARSDDEARTVLATACQQRRVQPLELTDVLTVLPHVRRRGLIRATIDDIAGGSEALSEIQFLRLCRRFDMPEPDRQIRRRDATGRNRYLDAYWQEWRLHVEVDGAHHMDAAHWAADMRRQNAIWIAGDRILRFPAWLVREQPATVAAQVRDALRAAGWRDR